MCNTIIFVRHGRAAPVKKDQDDLQRPLTKAGTYALRASFLKCFGAFSQQTNPKTDIVIWTSPALRARQTAAIICSIVGADGYIQHEPLYSADLTGILANAKADSHRIVILVGHAPALNKSITDLCGIALPFKPGSVAFLDVSKTNFMAHPEPEALHLFIQGLTSEPWETLPLIEETLSSQVDTVMKLYQNFMRNPADSNILHELRISIRTVRSLLTFISPYLKKKKTLRTLKYLHQLFFFTTQLRELDVLGAHAKTYLSSADRLQTFCAKERDVECTQIVETFSKAAFSDGLRHLMTFTSSLPWKNKVMLEGLRTSELTKHYQNLYEAYRSELTVLDYNNPTATHTARKHAKLLRYVSKYLSYTTGQDSSDTQERMHSIQDKLGEICDIRTTIILIQSFLDKKLSKTTKSELLELQEQEKKQLQKLHIQKLVDTN
jgi:CHAD domain-containing protein/phosphohistidine phosphatase SixA